jgi:preprotein translocase SecE subunit
MAKPTNQSEVSTSTKQSPKVSDRGNSGIIEYFKGVQAEWFKISWPTWPQIWAQTLVVLFMVIVISLGLLVIDKVFSFIMHDLLVAPFQNTH